MSLLVADLLALATVGSGVGLATVQKIARLYGGQASIEDTPGGGATFWVELEDAIRFDLEEENSAGKPQEG